MGKGNYPLLWSMTDLSRELRLSKAMLYRWLADGTFPFAVKKIRGQYRIVVASVLDWLESQPGVNRTKEAA